MNIFEESVYLMPLWIEIILAMLLLLLSGLFSGLNLGLMSLNKGELELLSRNGSVKERKWARAILPLRKRENLLLCSILFGNVLVNSVLTILMDDLTGSGLVAVASTTLGIAIGGKIIPQAICSRYGLVVGARTTWFTRFCMALTFPLSYPISAVLNRLLSEDMEMGYVCERARIQDILPLAEREMALVKDEAIAITGALQFSSKTVRDLMTKLENAFMIGNDATLDCDTVSLIMQSGFTRVPIYERERDNIVAVLITKDIRCIDVNERIPVHKVAQFFRHPVQIVPEDTHLEAMLEQFKKEHVRMAIVRSANDDGRGMKNLGLITLQDLVEEMVKQDPSARKKEDLSISTPCGAEGPSTSALVK